MKAIPKIRHGKGHVLGYNCNVLAMFKQLGCSKCTQPLDLHSVPTSHLFNSSHLFRLRTAVFGLLPTYCGPAQSTGNK